MSPVNDSQIKFLTIMSKILNSSLPISMNHPGYLLAFKEYLENQETLAADIENLLPHFLKVVKLWSNNMQRAKKKGVEEYLESCKTQLAVTYQMSLPAPIMRRLSNLLQDFKTNLVFTEEDLCSLVSTRITSISSMTARTQTERVGAHSSKKPRLCMDSEDELDPEEVDQIQTQSNLPTSRTYSTISTKNRGQPILLKLEDSWKDYHVEIKLWRSKDLVDAKDWKDKLNRMKKKIQFHFSENNTSMMQCLGQIERDVKQSLLQKGARWEINKYDGWKK
jgi:hypothetical protein